MITSTSLVYVLQNVCHDDCEISTKNGKINEQVSAASAVIVSEFSNQ